MEKERRARVVALRMRGFSYDDIQERVPVAKSTLSSWLRNMKIPEEHARRLQKRKMGSLLKFAEKRKSERLAGTAKIKQDAIENIKEISKRDLWLIGIVLYWARGLLEDDRRYGLGVRFSSADADLIRIFLAWLTRVGGIKRREISVDVFLHESRRRHVRDAVAYWSKATGFAPARFTHIYFQKNNLKRLPGKKNRCGLLRVRVKASTLLSRQIAGWIQGIKNNL